MQAWFLFYTVMAGASATLLGLLFVAVSVSAGTDFAMTHSTTRTLAAQAFHNYLAVLVIASVALFPDASVEMVGTVALLVASLGMFWSILRTINTFRHRAADHHRWPALRRHTASMLGLGLLLLASFWLWARGNGSLHLLAAGIIVLLVSSATISWQLLARLAARES